MSLNGMFESSRRSLRSLEAAMQTAGHNVANAGTPGFHRRRLDTTSASVSANGVTMRPMRGTFMGAGMAVVGYTRVRDGLLESAAWQAQTGLGGAEEGVRLGAALEAILDPESAGSLNGALRAFWNAWGDAANAPTDPGVRTVLLRQGEALADAFHRLDADLGRLRQESATSLTDGVSEANRLFSEIAGLNERIAAARAAGATDLDAEDARDEAVRTLATLVPVRVGEAADGSYTVTVQGMAVVEGRETLPLERVGPPAEAAHGVRFRGTSVSLGAGDGLGHGRIGAALAGLNTALPEAQAALDALAARLVSEVNAAHEGGYGLDNGTGRAFFDPAGTTAASLAAALTDPAHVALAGAADAPGDTAVGRAIAALGPGFDEEALALSSTAGQRLGRARAEASVQGALASHLDALAAGVGGVSIDEEMTRLIEYQQAYAASARVIQTAQSLFDTLLAL